MLKFTQHKQTGTRKQSYCNKLHAPIYHVYFLSPQIQCLSSDRVCQSLVLTQLYRQSFAHFMLTKFGMVLGLLLLLIMRLKFVFVHIYLFNSGTTIILCLCSFILLVTLFLFTFRFLVFSTLCLQWSSYCFVNVFFLSYISLYLKLQVKLIVTLR